MLAGNRMTGSRRTGWVGAIEGGGTKFICAVAEAPGKIVARAVIPTRDASTTLAECIDFLRATGGRHGGIEALGIACFGPLQLRPDAPDHGAILQTPKPGWSGVGVLATCRDALGIPVAIDTDVGSAAWGELQAGAGRGLRSLAYVTVGTGIGGAVAPAAAVARLMHAEMGHLRVRRDVRDDGFAGVCPFHGDCLEGLASGLAIRARWGCDLAALDGAHPGRSIIAGYIAQLAAAIALLHAPECIVIGGGVLSDEGLLPLVREATLAVLAGYLPFLADAGQAKALIRPPLLGTDSAITGAILMALAAAEGRA
jgi:fructokinase